MKKPSRKTLIRNVDEACKALLAVLKPQKFCFTCGRSDRPLHWSHLITATRYATRWDIDNLEWMCDPCNSRHEFYPEYYQHIYLDLYGTTQYKDLLKRSWSREGKRFSDLELNQLILKFELLIKKELKYV